MARVSPKHRLILKAIGKRRAVAFTFRELGSLVGVTLSGAYQACLKLRKLGLIEWKGDRTVHLTRLGRFLAEDKVAGFVVPELKCACGASRFGVSECWICKEKKT